jgi:nucleoprotein TPR
LHRTQAEQARAQAEGLALAEERAVALTAQVSELKVDVARFQALAQEAGDNYRREVTMHSRASEEVLALQRQLDQAKAEGQAAVNKLSDVTAQLLRAEAALDEERKSAAAQSKDKEVRAADLQATNALLHSQLQTLGAQIARFQENRTLIAESSGEAESEEMLSLRKASIELREVVRFMKREQDVLEAKLSVSESECSRLKANVGNLQKLFDEAKAELSREMERRVVSRDDEEFARLMGEVGQLNLVRESNSHLRAENEDLQKRLAKVATELSAIRQSEAPLKEQLRTATAEKGALESERASLLAEVGYWKDRLQSLVSRYNEVDPEEHRLLQVRHDEVSARVAALEASAAEHAKELEAVRTKETELAAELVMLRIIEL